MASLDPSASEGRTGAAEDHLPQLPVELLLEIVQRSDAVTVVRFAATQKLLRGAILAPAFRRRLAASAGVDPALLLGLSFRSDRWEWGAVRDTSFPLHERLPNPSYGSFYCPAVIGRTVYWLCSLPPRCPHDFRNSKILALDVDAAEAVVRNVPAHCFSSGVSCCSEHGINDHVLLASLRGQLCLFVLDGHGISAWTTPSDDSETTTTWSQQVMVTMPELQMKTRVDPLSLNQVHLHAFGERSSTMIVEVTPGLLFRFEIGQESNSKGARFVKLGTKFRHVAYLCLHEIHLVSLLQTMKSFPEGSLALEATTEA